MVLMTCMIALPLPNSDSCSLARFSISSMLAYRKIFLYYFISMIVERRIHVYLQYVHFQN